ncbi:MAG: hypothetical protein HY569_02380 [Candidatus Magasanikbacteria bacterium]|nr:hypothetical protein [Candidatus Magasanikbacteria bacterium]
MNKIAITAAVIVVVALGGYFIFREKSQPASSAVPAVNQQATAESSPVSEASAVEVLAQPSIAQLAVEAEATVIPVVEKKTITYTGSGFSPAMLKIKKGETVIFKNQSAESMWPASAMHPTHAVYPTTGGCIGSTFDACQNIQPGSSWLFQFNIVGNWKYHNHLNPSEFGAIIVE